MLTDKPPPCVSHKKSSETTYGYCLPKFESVCCWKLKIFLFFFFGWKFMLKYMIRLNIKHLSKLIYKGKSRLKELYKISRRFRSHIVSLHESSQRIPGNSLQTTRWSSYRCQGLIESIALAVKVKTQRRIIEPSSYKQVIPLSLKRQLNQLEVARRLNSLTEGQSELQYSKVN